MARHSSLATIAGLLVLSGAVVGCGEPDGACYYPADDGGKGCFETSASQCNAIDGNDFKEGESCLAWDLLHPPT